MPTAPPSGRTVIDDGPSPSADGTPLGWPTTSAAPLVLGYGRGGPLRHGGGDVLARIAAFATPAFAYLACVLGCMNVQTPFPRPLAWCVGWAVGAVPAVGAACGTIAFFSTRPRRRRRLLVAALDGVVAVAVAVAAAAG